MCKRGEFGKLRLKNNGGNKLRKTKILRVLSTIFVITIFLSISTVSFAENDAIYRIVKATSLNIRQQASTSSQIVGQVPYAGKVKILWLEPDWARITYNGTEGYVAREYLVVPSEFKALPSRSEGILSKGQAVAEFAKQYIGVPYSYGGSSPRGFDCSGFVYYVYKQFGVTLNRVANDQMTNGRWVPFSEIAPGDIIGFKNSSGYVNHVGIYVGNGMMIHSPQTGEYVRYESVVSGNYANRMAAVRRIF